VFTPDLLGNGTSCLCWVGTDGAKTNELVISYLDLSEGKKPHVLQAWSNGIGLNLSAKYAPSTKFYLQDEHEGRPWRTKLPFPVHVVSRLTVADGLSRPGSRQDVDTMTATMTAQRKSSEASAWLKCRHAKMCSCNTSASALRNPRSTRGTGTKRAPKRWD
jgi:hypothetical protein